MGRIHDLCKVFFQVVALKGPPKLVIAGFACSVSLFISLISPASAAESDFPFPESLRPAVDFWIQVYSEVNTEDALLHDASNLTVIYDTVDYEEEVIKQGRAAIRQDLRVLAGGKREGLTASQQDILSLWPEGVSNDRLARAADSIRYQRGQADRFQRGIRRSGAFREYIESVVQERGLPIELAALPHVESSFQTGAYSSASAGGMWQFMSGTARRFMRVDYLVDERLDPYVSTHAAMDLLQANYEMLGTWPLALTAYNHGAYGIERAVKQVGSTDIDRIVEEYKGPRFGFASRNFYAQFLASLEVERRQEEFFGTTTLETPRDFVEVELPLYLDAGNFADSLGVDIKQLQRDNPALRPPVWSGEKRIPRGYRLRVDSNHYNGDLLAAIDQLPPTLRYAEQIPDERYTVRQGDSLSGIASSYNVSVSDLVAINQLRNRDQIRIGQTLLLPSSGSGSGSATSGSQSSQAIAYDRYEVRRGDTLEVIALRHGVSVSDLVTLNQLPNRNFINIGQTLLLPGPDGNSEAVVTGSGSLIPPSGRYEVRRGDTLSRISYRFKVSMEELLTLNDMAESDVIFPGQTLWLMESGETEEIREDVSQASANAEVVLE